MLLNYHSTKVTLPELPLECQLRPSREPTVPRYYIQLSGLKSLSAQLEYEAWQGRIQYFNRCSLAKRIALVGGTVLVLRQVITVETRTSGIRFELITSHFFKHGVPYLSEYSKLPGV